MTVLLSLIITILIPLSIAEYLFQYSGGVDLKSLVSHQPLLVLSFILSLILTLSLLLRKKRAKREGMQSSGPISGSEAVPFLALLQSRGRLIDFAMEELQGLSDEEVAGAARAVHAGCHEVLMSCFAPAPVASAEEGGSVSGITDTRTYKLVGKVGSPPFSGTLLHPGWKATKMSLPRADAEGKDLFVIAPAEVEVA